MLFCCIKVMCIKTKSVADAMVIIVSHSFSIFAKSKLVKLTLVKLYHHLIQLCKCQSRSCPCNYQILSFKNSVVDFFLALCKFTIDRKCSGNIRTIMLIRTSQIDQDKFPIFYFLIIVLIVKCCCSHATGNDTWKCMFLNSLFHQCKIKRTFQFTLIHTRISMLHHCFNRASCCFLCTFHFIDFNIRFYTAHCCQRSYNIINLNIRIFFLKFSCKFVCLCICLSFFVSPKIKMYMDLPCPPGCI